MEKKERRFKRIFKNAWSFTPTAYVRFHNADITYRSSFANYLQTQIPSLCTKHTAVSACVECTTVERLISATTALNEYRAKVYSTRCASRYFNQSINQSSPGLKQRRGRRL